MSKELEALLNDVDTLQGMYMETRASKDKKAWFHSFADDLRNDIKQALQIPTLDELREEIIDGLNECYGTELFDYNGGNDISEFSCDDDDNDVRVSITNHHKKTSNIYAHNTYEEQYTHELPINLAHKITTYFKRLEQENENI